MTLKNSKQIVDESVFAKFIDVAKIGVDTFSSEDRPDIHAAIDGRAVGFEMAELIRPSINNPLRDVGINDNRSWIQIGIHKQKVVQAVERIVKSRIPDCSGFRFVSNFVPKGTKARKELAESFAEKMIEQISGNEHPYFKIYSDCFGYSLSCYSVEARNDWLLVQSGNVSVEPSAWQNALLEVVIKKNKKYSINPWIGSWVERHLLIWFDKAKPMHMWEIFEADKLVIEESDSCYFDNIYLFDLISKKAWCLKGSGKISCFDC